ncbi:MAG: sigma-54-dependent transcriptional regulator, partial [Planctomycetota bacterium]
MSEPLDRPGQVLLVDDEKDLRWLLASFLERRGIEVVEAASAEEARERFRENPIDAVISDVRMPGDSGLDLMRDLHSIDPWVPVLMISALEDVSTAVEAMKLGAYDYLTKPFDNDRLLNLVRRALETRSLREEVDRLRSGRGRGIHTFGVSPEAQKLYHRVRLIAETPGLSVVIQGESGTGKEVLARTVHDISPRRDEPFVAVD